MCHRGIIEFETVSIMVWYRGILDFETISCCHSLLPRLVTWPPLLVTFRLWRPVSHPILRQYVGRLWSRHNWPLFWGSQFCGRTDCGNQHNVPVCEEKWQHSLSCLRDADNFSGRPGDSVHCCGWPAVELYWRVHFRWVLQTCMHARWLAGLLAGWLVGWQREIYTEQQCAQVQVCANYESFEGQPLKRHNSVVNRDGLRGFWYTFVVV